MTKINKKDFLKIIEIYIAQVKVPENFLLTEQIIICPIGIIGSGKTTVMKLLSEKLGLVRISGDEIRTILREKGFNYDAARQIASETMEFFLEQGLSIGIDSDCVSEESQNGVKEFSKIFEAKVFWIHINSPEKFIFENLGKQKTNLIGTPEERLNNYYRRILEHQNLNFPFIYTFDLSRGDIEEQVSEAVDIIKNVTKNTL